MGESLSVHLGMKVCWGFCSKGDRDSFPSRASFVFSHESLLNF